MGIGTAPMALTATLLHPASLQATLALAGLTKRPLGQSQFITAELQAHRVLHQFPLCLHLCGQQDTRIPNIRIIIMLGAVLTSTLSTPPLTPQWGDLCHKCIIIIFIPFLHLRTCSIIINLCRSRSPSVAPLPLCMTRTSCIPILIIIQHKSKSFAMTLSPPGIFINLVLTTRLFVSILVSLLEARSCSSIIYHQT